MILSTEYVQNKELAWVAVFVVELVLLVQGTGQHTDPIDFDDPAWHVNGPSLFPALPGRSFRLVMRICPGAIP